MADRDRMIRPKRMGTELAEILTADIRDGVYEVGASLPAERELSQTFGVSRLTVREALSSLEKSGLIVLRSGTRARVRAPNMDNVLDMLSGAAALHFAGASGVENIVHFQDARMLIECGVARLAATRATQAQLGDLRARLEDNRRSIGDTERFGQTDMEFHFAIADTVANPILNGFYIAVDRWLNDARQITLSDPRQVETAFEAHARIYAAIEAGDPDGADAAMRAHLSQVHDLYRERRQPAQP